MIFGAVFVAGAGAAFWGWEHREDHAEFMYIGAVVALVAALVGYVPYTQVVTECKRLAAQPGANDVFGEFNVSRCRRIGVVPSDRFP